MEGVHIIEKKSGKIGLIETVINDVYIVNFDSIKKKMYRRDFDTIKNVSTLEEFVEITNDIDSDDEIRAVFGDKINENDLNIIKTGMAKLKIDLMKKLYIE